MSSSTVLTDDQKQIHWLRSCLMQRSRDRAEQLAQMPDWVPSRVRLDADVRGDYPDQSTVVLSGEYDCECNRWGAITVVATDGEPLGIRPTECVILSMKANGLKAILVKEQAEEQEVAS